MKKIIFISLFIFWAVTAAILTAGLVFRNSKPSQGLTQAVNDKASTTNANTSGLATEKTNLESSQPSSTGTGGARLVLTASEIAKHSKANDCWMIVNGKVYNVTSYVNSHPGGFDTIVSGCGKDATAIFQSIHKPSTTDLLAQFYLGDLNQIISAGAGWTAGQSSVSGNINSPVSSPNIPTRRERKNNDD